VSIYIDIRDHVFLKGIKINCSTNNSMMDGLFVVATHMASKVSRLQTFRLLLMEILKDLTEGPTTGRNISVLGF
jgi:cAMP phosphodiesterase